MSQIKTPTSAKKSGIPVYVGRNCISKRKKTGTKYILSDEVKANVKKAFDFFDADCNGFIELHQLKDAIDIMGIEVTDDEVIRIVNKIDIINETGRISLKNFQQIMTNKLSEIAAKNDLLRTFHLFDMDNTGKISYNNFKRMANNLGEIFTDDELKELLDEADLDNDGEINQNEFLHLMQ